MRLITVVVGLCVMLLGFSVATQADVIPTNDQL
jgi:hypothetical protein